MRFALQVSGDYDHVREAAQYAERAGLAALALPDHYLMALNEEEAKTTPANDAFVQLGGLATATATLELVVLVSPITFRHPAVLLKMGITLDQMSSGRFSLGLGTGWMDREHEVFGFDYPETGERFARLEEALAYVSAGIASDHPGFAGDRYTLRPFPIAPQASPGFRLVVGGTGPHTTPRLAGTYAHEFNVYPGPGLEKRIARARNAARDAGRDPDELLISSAGQVHGADTATDLDEILDELAAEAGMTRADLDEAHARRNSPVGTWDQLAERFAVWEKVGVERFYLQRGWDPEETPQLLGRLGA